jgi:hypothetical protein
MTELPERFSPRHLFEHLTSLTQDPYFRDGLTQDDRELRRQNIITIEEKIGDNPKLADYRAAFPNDATEVEVFHQNVLLARERIAWATARDLGNALTYVLPPGIGAALLRKEEPANAQTLRTTLSDCHALSEALYRFLTKECRLPSSGGKDGDDFELFAPVEKYGARVAAGSAPLLRFHFAYSTLHEVSLVTPLGEMRCFRGANGLGIERSEEVLLALGERFGLKPFVQTRDDRVALGSMVRHERPFLLKIGDAPARLPQYPWTNCSFSDSLPPNVIPAPRQRVQSVCVGTIGKIGGLEDREFVHQANQALPAIRDVSGRAAYVGDLPREVFLKAAMLYDRHQGAPDKIILDLFDADKSHRRGAVVALAAMGPQAVEAILCHDKSDYMTEDFAEVLRLWGAEELPPNTVVGPGLSPFIYERSAKMVFAALDQTGVDALLETALGLMGAQTEPRQTIRLRATEMLDCENELLHPSLRRLTEAGRSPEQIAFCMDRLSNLPTKVQGDSSWVATALNELVYWSPTKPEELELQRSGIHGCIKLLAEAEAQPSAELLPKLVDAFKFGMRGLPSNFIQHFEALLRRYGTEAMAAFGEMEEHYRAEGSPNAWEHLMYSTTRIMRSSTEGWEREKK